MTLEVQFYRGRPTGDELVGTIRWDGHSLTADPPDAHSLQNTIQQHILINENGTMHHVSPQDGERWIRGLCRQYKSPYFYATEAKEVPDAAALR